MGHKTRIAQSCREGFMEATSMGYCTARDLASPDFDDPVGRRNGVEAIWRLLESGLLVCDFWVDTETPGEGIRTYMTAEKPFSLVTGLKLDEPAHGDHFAYWLAMSFIHTPTSRALVEEFDLMNARYVPPAFTARLTEIFTQHGVGWDVPCPIKIVEGPSVGKNVGKGE